MSDTRNNPSLNTLFSKSGIAVSQRRGRKLIDHIEFIDESGRNIIYEWSKEREHLRSKLWYRTKRYLITFKMLLTFGYGITIVVFINILLTLVLTYICQKYDISFDLQATLLLTPIIFPLSFLINNDFQRREKALLYMAKFKTCVYNLFIQSREMGKLLNIKDEVKSNLYNKLNQIVFHVTEYVLTSEANKRSSIAKIIYEDLSDISQIISDYFNHKDFKTYAPLFISRLLNLLDGITASFEELRVIRDYRSPYSTRSFAKIMSFALPILLCPFYVEISHKVPKTQNWSPYTIGSVFAFTLGILQSVQDRLYDPFVSYNNDAIDVSEVVQWAAESFVHTATRTYQIGRFRVDRKYDTKVVLQSTRATHHNPMKFFKKQNYETVTHHINLNNEHNTSQEAYSGP